MQKPLAILDSTGSAIDTEADAVTELRAQLERHPADGYPVQHATACFHLGHALLELGRTDEAERTLARAVELFEGRLPLEQAKSLNLLGVAQRQAGRPDEAAASFIAAAAGFGAGARPLEQGAAVFNLGLTRTEQGDHVAAATDFRTASELLDPTAVPAQAAAAARELGAALLAQGAAAEAIPVLREAVRLADEVEDTAGMGAAANSLGLALLAEGDPAAALDSLRMALAAHPRSVRPSDFALVKANVALAHEALDDLPRARLAARQALGVEELPEAVTGIAVDLLQRHGTPRTVDLLAVLTGQPEAALAPILREELVRLAALPEELRHLEAGEWVAALVDDPDTRVELVAAWLGALLELPPGDIETVVATTVASTTAAAPTVADRFREALERAYARFHEPQAVRVRGLVAAAARDQDAPGWT